MATSLANYAAIVFDFDGTIADSFGAITASVNHVRIQRGHSTLGRV